MKDVTSLAIGQDLTRDLLTHTVMAVPGVKSVEWASPSEDIVNVSADGVARLNSMSITAKLAAEA